MNLIQKCLHFFSLSCSIWENVTQFYDCFHLYSNHLVSLLSVDYSLFHQQPCDYFDIQGDLMTQIADLQFAISETKADVLEYVSENDPGCYDATKCHVTVTEGGEITVTMMDGVREITKI